MKIQIGDIEREYVVVRTTAPDSYDGFGTITVYRTRDRRFVIVDTRHLDWQLNRYGSGNHMGEVESKIADNFIAEKLYQRLCNSG